MKKIFFPFIALLLVGACTKEQLKVEEKPEQTTGRVEVSDDSGFVPGVCNVYLSEELADMIESDVAAGKIMTRSMALNSAFDEFGIVKIERLFEYNAETEARTRAEGLHRWYRLTYDASYPVTKAGEDLKAVSGVEHFEGQRHIQSMAIFNDPYFPKQWHYINDKKAGADINVQSVWEDYTTGSEEVIVGVVDGGIDQNHPDLKDNLIGGRNFFGGNITAHLHGTHVAGTIGAVNNNGIGVVGIAGGDKANGVNGVKLLSCQIFQEGATTTVSTAAAIRYAADNGAVICQNSWGYAFDYDGNGRLEGRELTDALNAKVQQSDKDAIDYFIKYAGKSPKTNEQVGPMDGGVVIFAAGNDGIRNGAPANYEPVIAVGAIGQYGTKAPYSNYGDWVDIAAPGTGVWSTAPNSTYKELDGTSMACPHVSGVAALVVSYYGGKGFTNQALKDRLLKGAKQDFIPNSTIGPLVDALGAMTYSSGNPPKQVTEYTVKGTGNTLDFEWEITANDAGLRADHFMLYAAPAASAFDNFDPNNLAKDVRAVSVQTSGKAGEMMKGRLMDLEFEKTYYAAILAQDYAGNSSALSAVKEVRTTKNNAPVISLPSGVRLVFKQHETGVIPLSIIDPDGHKLKVEISTGSEAVTVGQSIDGVWQLNVVGKNAEAGKYTVSAKATDPYGLVATKTFQYEILQNQAPVKIKDFGNILSSVIGDKYQLDASEFISDPDGETPTYEAVISNRNVLNINQQGNILYIITTGYGTSDVEIVARDVMGATVRSSFRVVVREEETIDVYPNPVIDNLYVVTGSEELPTEVKLTSSNGSVLYEGTPTISAFTPLVINMKKAAPGRYSVSVKFGGKEYTRTVTKK